MIRLLLLCPVPLLAVVGWASTAQSPKVDASNRSPLAFSQYAIVHGEVQPRPVVEATFRFTNQSGKDVRITELVPSCGCLQPRLDGGAQDGRATVFAAGESGLFTIGVETANEAPGRNEYSVVVESESEGQSFEQTVRYIVTLPQAKVTVSPQTLLFYQLQAEAGEQTVQLFDPRSEPASITALDVDHPLVSASSSDSSTPGVTKIVVRVDEGLEPGMVKTLLRIETDDAEYPVIRVPVVLQGPRAAIATP